MPIYPSRNLSLIHGLSGFWPAFFKDTGQIDAFYQGVELNLGQLYLSLLENVLSTSLTHAPVFSKDYYKLFVIGEDELFYQEGASSDDDRLAFTPPNYQVVDAKCLMSGIIEPKHILESKLDFDVQDGALKFFANPFTTLTTFPVRVVAKSFPSSFTNPTGVAWSANVKVGDTFRLRTIGSPSAFTSVIRGVDGARLLLDTALPEFRLDYGVRSFKTTVLRKPFDAVKTGVQLADHAAFVGQLGTGSFSGSVVPGGPQINVGAESYYRGAWAASTAYAEGDLAVVTGPTLARAKQAHTSGVSYDSTKWDLLIGQYVYVEHEDQPQNNGLFSVVSTSGAAITLDRAAFGAGTSNRAKFTFVRYAIPTGSPRPVLTLDHTFIEPGTFQLNTRRDHDVVVSTADGPVRYPAGGVVLEGVDFQLDYETGELVALSGWDPLLWARANYTWSYEVVTETFVNRGNYANFFFYEKNSLVRYNLETFVCTTAHFATSFDPTMWKVYTPVFKFDQTKDVKQMALWGADVLHDRQTLYENFGHLLSFERPSSEQYRTFLQGVAQLFVLGPSLGRFESALNVLAELPVVRDDNETLVKYKNGIDASGSDGVTIDTHAGRDGVLSAAGTFSAASASFYASDVGAQIRTRAGAYESIYVVTAVLSATSVQVTPTPTDATAVVWTAQHVSLTQRFRTGSYVFTDEDINAEVRISGAGREANNGRFRIVGVENASTVILESEFALVDETGLSWTLSRTRTQTVQTTRDTYSLPYYVPIRADVADATNEGVLTFKAFEALTKAFHISDYIEDPTWWHGLSVPKEVLQLQVETAGRRRVSTELVEHTLSPKDGAFIGDVGLWVGGDDAGRPGIERRGTMIWYGGSSVKITEAGVEAERRDVGRYVQINVGGVNAQFRIQAIADSGTLLTLERFPPKELKRQVPPIAGTFDLPSQIFRRSVGFVIMDRYLKYHALYVEIDPSVALHGSRLGDALELLRQAKPAYTYVYLDTPQTFYEDVIASDSMELEVGAPLSELIAHVDPTIYASGSGLQFNDAYRFTSFTESIAGTPGVYVLSPTLPPAGAAPRTVRFHAVKGRFDLSATISGRHIVEGLDYTFDRATATLTVLTALPGPLDFHYVAVIIRKRLEGDVLEDGETRICLGGANPIAGGLAAPVFGQTGLIDRAVQLILAP